ncbi:MAG: polymer-forming cytoskeletal protein [bacterium]
MRPHLRALITLLAALLPSALWAQSDSTRELSRVLERLAKGEQIQGLPPADSVAPAGRVIPAGATVHGTVVARGPVDVSGTVEGSVVSLVGDVTIRSGGRVTGDAVAVAGRVVADGRVDGEMRTMSALPTLPQAIAPRADTRSALERTVAAVQVVAGSFGVLLVIAIGVLLFAGQNLAEVVETVERRFSRAFWVGLAAQLLLLPGVVVLCIALALTLIGILLIPFAVVAYAIAVAGLVTLGFLAVAQLIGGALWRGRDSSERRRAFGGLVVGVAIFFALWFVASLLVWAPLAATVVRAAAVAATWAAMTLGLGAAVLSRAGTHRRVASGSRPVELAAWQTPTPITGVVAARRPVAAAKEAR